MRRCLSTLLVLFFGFWPLTGMLEASDDSRLPPCCRRHGAHHCAMAMQMAAMMARAAADSTPMLTAPATCPLFPGSQAGCSIPSDALAAAAAELAGPTVGRHAPLAAHAERPTSPLRTYAGRGPPMLSL